MKRLLLTSTLEHFGKKLPLVFGDTLKTMDVLCIPTAAYAEGNCEEWLPLEQEQVKSQVRSYSEFDIKDKTQEDLIAALHGKNVLYVTGGNTYYLLDYMNKIGFKDVLLDFFERDGIYFGTSAGSVVASPDIGCISPMESKDRPVLDDLTGLNLIDFSFIPHLDAPHFQHCIDACIENGRTLNRNFVALKEDQALWIEDNYIQTY